MVCAIFLITIVVGIDEQVFQTKFAKIGVGKFLLCFSFKADIDVCTFDYIMIIGSQLPACSFYVGHSRKTCTSRLDRILDFNYHSLSIPLASTQIQNLVLWYLCLLR